MVLSQSLYQTVTAAIRNVSPDDFAIQSITAVSGGDINQAFRIETSTDAYFVKTNDIAGANKMFLAESNGLAMLRHAPGVQTPQTFMVGEANGEAFLLMEWLPPPSGRESRDAAQEKLGRMVADLHRQSSDVYGLDHDNYIGRLPQRNNPTTDWSTFFARYRLQKQLDMAGYDALPKAMRTQFEQLVDRLDLLYPSEAPALLHGDLWGGNYLITDGAQPVLIDPAVYFGNREMDIAMTRLFGGFSERFYAAYQEAYPLQPGWEDRVDLWNLYPLLVHLNLFGASYMDAVQRHLKKYV